MVETKVEKQQGGHGAPTISVTVFAPRTPEPRQMTFVKTMSVGDAAAAAAVEFGYSGGNPTFAKDGTVLDRQKPLVAEGVRDADELELVDAGQGV